MKTDLEIQQDVMEEIKWEPLLKVSEIGVAVRNGVVTLSGLVDTYTKKRLAELAAERVHGVRAIAEDIEVKIPGTGKKRDPEIAETALNLLKVDSSIFEENIKVKVENGFLTLEGEVEWEFLKSAAEKAVENLVGVRGICNLIKINSKIDPIEIKKKITTAFHRNATIDTENIKIETLNHKVILTGTVSSWIEKKEAERAAWLAPGVNTVENRLEVDTEIYAY